jgi:hypothetical protein
MKRRRSIVIGLVLFLTCAPVLRAQVNAQLRAKVAMLYESADRALGTKDLEGYMSLLAPDYEHIYIGKNRAGTRSLFKDVFDGYEALRSQRTILQITPAGNWTQVVSDVKMEGRTRQNDWEIITQGTTLDLLVQEGGRFRFSRSTPIDKRRLADVSGRTYTDSQSGLSFTVPKGWMIFPTAALPNIQGCAFVLAPDGSSGAMIGHIRATGVTARKAVEGDDAVTKLLSKPEVYRLIQSGPVRINGREGYESETRFFMPMDRERHRRRVYLDADGLLYVLCFDAIPARQWNLVTEGFQAILDSVR